MIASAVPHVGIIGGGFSGTMTAVHLARLAEVPLRVTLINHRYPQGRGIAYSTRRPEHLLNVAARNMSALPDHPNHFIEWLRTRTEYADVPEAELRETFMPRRVYGDYVRALALSATRPFHARSCVDLTCIDEEATDIAPDGERARVFLQSGDSFTADKIVLATGNESPAALPGSDALTAHAAYCANPWQNWEARLPAPTDNIVLVGTGLTAVDAIVTLLALDWRGTIHAVSRQGLLPQSHFKGIDYPDFPPRDVDLAQLGLAGLVNVIEEHCARLRQQGENPAIVIDKMRPHTQHVWQTFSSADRREFIGRYATRWNVLRHRIAQPIHQRVAAALESGRLKITSGGVSHLEPNEHRIRVRLRGRDGERSPAPIEAALVINCTGPDTRFSATPSPLLRALLASGLAQPDAMDMGIRVQSDFSVVSRDGERSPWLYALGPLLRGTLWESIAVPELRGQAFHVAENLLGEFPAKARRTAARPHPIEEPAVIEYLI